MKKQKDENMEFGEFNQYSHSEDFESFQSEEKKKTEYLYNDNEIIDISEAKKEGQ